MNNSQKTLTVQDTTSLKVMCLFCMLWLHLFDRWDYQTLFEPLIFLNGIPLSFYLGQLSDFCVYGFAICSGIGNYLYYKSHASSYRYRLKSVMHLYLHFWLVLFLFTLISVIAGKSSFMPGSFETFIKNFFSIDFIYNGTWWYITTFAFLMLISPVLLNLADRIISAGYLVLAIVIAVLTYTAGFYIRFYLTDSPWIIRQAGSLMNIIPCYLVGIWIAKYNLFVSWKEGINRFIPKISIQLFLGLVVFLILLLVRTLVLPNAYFAVFSGLPVMFLFYLWKKSSLINKFLLFFGKYSTFIWLIHFFFIRGLFPDFAYLAKYPILIFGFLLLISLLFSIILEKINRYLIRLVRRYLESR